MIQRNSTLKKKLTDKQIEKNIVEVQATLAMEDMYLTDIDLTLLHKYAKGEITGKEIIKIFKAN